jgi:hypothetical protein
MRKFIYGALAAAGLAGSAFILCAAAAPGDATPKPQQMQRMMDDHAAMLDASLAGMKAGLKLTPDQEKNWTPFETAVRDAAKARQDAMRKMVEMRKPGERPSPIDRMDFLADRLAEGSATLKSIASAAKPLYASLDETQQRHFGELGRMMMREGRWEMAMGRRHEHGWGGGMMGGDMMDGGMRSPADAQ